MTFPQTNRSQDRVKGTAPDDRSSIETSPASIWRKAVLFSLGYLLCAEASHYLSVQHSPFITFWLPSGLYVAVLLLNDSRAWPWLALAVLPANLAFDIPQGTKVSIILIFYCANTVQAVTGAWLIRRFVAERPTLATLKEYLGLVGFSAVLSTMLGATIVAAFLSGFSSMQSFIQTWINWWTGAAMAILLFSSFILTWFTKPDADDQHSPGQDDKLWEAVLLAAMSIALTMYLLFMRQGIMTINRSALVLPLLWAALRFGPRGATAAVLLVALPIAFFTTQYFIGLTPGQVASGEYVSNLQSTMAIASLIGVIPAILIENHKRTIVELHESEERLRNLNAAAFEGIFITENGRMTDMNEQGLKMFGYDRSEMIGRDPCEFVSPETRSIVMEAIRDNRETVYEHQLIRKDGSLFYAEAQAKVTRVGNRTLRMTAIRDVTGQRKLAEQLRQSQKMEAVGQLASGVAHDFNNILSVIYMQAEMLRDEDYLKPQHREFATEICKASERAANLTRQLLLFSRKQAMQLREIDLNNSVANITKMLQRLLGENIQVQCKLAPHSLVVRADAGMIDQVLINLTVNARDAMTKGGNLFIETSVEVYDSASTALFPQSRPGSFACLTVSDTGCGIPPEILPQIFNPFFTTKDVGKGTGLGLATVFGILQQHEGWINIASEVGHGTSFKIYLPWLPEAASQPAAKEMPASSRGGNETILLVEDDPSLRMTIKMMLSRLGYHTLEASTGISALEVWKYKHDEIDLLLTDLMMPDGINGKDLAQRLLHENPSLKVIYMSGYAADIAGKDLTLTDGDNFLNKPFEAEKFAQTLRKRLDG